LASRSDRVIYLQSGRIVDAPAGAAGTTDAVLARSA
jgi:hypothetical protein